MSTTATVQPSRFGFRLSSFIAAAPKPKPLPPAKHVEATKKRMQASEDKVHAGENAEETQARAREKARVRAIMTSAPGLENPIAAAHLALDTDMPRGKAIKVVADLNGVAEDAESDREAGRGGPVSATAGAILAAGAKARGEGPTHGRRERMSLRAGEAPRQAPVARQGRDTDADGRPLSLAAQSIVDAGRRRRGEA